MHICVLGFRFSVICLEDTMTRLDLVLLKVKCLLLSSKGHNDIK